MFLDDFLLPLQNWWFLLPDDQKLPYDDVTVPVVADVFAIAMAFLLLLLSLSLLASI